MRILIVEDNQDFRRFLKIRLEEHCFAVDTAATGDLGLARAEENQYDLVLLDYDLPVLNGYEVCLKLRENARQMPIIMISGTSDVRHKVEGFNLGIDDYLVKPFFFEELLARINALIRRPGIQNATQFSFEDLSLDTAKQTVRRGGVPIYLTRKEFTLLEHLMRNSGNVVPRGDILDHVWNSDLSVFSNAIETHIMNLRKKIDTPKKRKLIHSIPGRGYKIDIRK
jgi:DNA-binding response OmpR family regulator